MHAGLRLIPGTDILVRMLSKNHEAGEHVCVCVISSMGEGMYGVYILMSVI